MCADAGRTAGYHVMKPLVGPRLKHLLLPQWLLQQTTIVRQRR